MNFRKLPIGLVCALLVYCSPLPARAQLTGQVCDYADGIYHCKPLSGTVSTKAGTTYTLSPLDCGTQVNFTNASGATVTIPAMLPTGCNISILQVGAGIVAVNGSAVPAATLKSAHSFTGTFGQWAMIGISIEANSDNKSAVAILTGDGA